MFRFRSRVVIISFAVLTFSIVFWPESVTRTVDKTAWQSTIKDTSEIAELRWDIEFKIDGAPALPFAFVSTYGRDILHGFHLTIDMYGNGFLVLSDVRDMPPTNQIVWLGHPLTGTHKFSMHFRQRGEQLLWKHVEVFLDGVEVPFRSGDPNKTIDLEHVSFVPDVISDEQLASIPSSGEILSETLSVQIWQEDTYTFRALLLPLVFFVFVVIQVQRKMRME